MEPVILDIFTSAKDSLEPKKTFNPGDTIQWNVMHTVNEGDFDGRQYRIYFHINNWALMAGVWDGHACEALFRPLVVVKADFNYGLGVNHTFWQSDGIGTFPDGLSIRYEGRRETLLKVGGRDIDLMMYAPGFWEFTAYVRLTEPHTGNSFDVMSDWHYLIMPGQG